MPAKLPKKQRASFLHLFDCVVLKKIDRGKGEERQHAVCVIDLYDGLDLSTRIDTMVHNNENYESNHVQESQQNCEHLTTIGFIYRKYFVGE